MEFRLPNSSRKSERQSTQRLRSDPLSLVACELQTSKRRENMNKKEAFEKLAEIDRKVTLINHICAVLGWDFETTISPKGGEERGAQLAYLEESTHDLLTSKQMDEIFSVINSRTPGFDDREHAIIRIMEKSWKDSRNVPSSLVAALAKATSAAY